MPSIAPPKRTVARLHASSELSHSCVLQTKFSNTLRQSMSSIARLKQISLAHATANVKMRLKVRKHEFRARRKVSIKEGKIRAQRKEKSDTRKGKVPINEKSLLIKEGKYGLEKGKAQRKIWTWEVLIKKEKRNRTRKKI